MPFILLFGVGNSDWYVLLIPFIILLGVFKAGEWYGERKYKQASQKKELDVYRLNDITEWKN